MGPLDETVPTNPYAPPRIQIDVPPTRKQLTEGIDLSRENPFFTIWFRPRATIRGIVNVNPDYLVIRLAVGSGIIRALNFAASQNAGDRRPFSNILNSAFFLGAIYGVISLYVWAWFVGLSSRWLGGRADSRKVRAALAWSSVPVLAAIPFWIVQLAILGHEMFTSETPSIDANPALLVFVIAAWAIEIVLSIWSLVIFMKTLAEVQEFSAYRALGAILLITLIILVPIIILVVIASSPGR